MNFSILVTQSPTSSPLALLEPAFFSRSLNLSSYPPFACGPIKVSPELLPVCG